MSIQHTARVFAIAAVLVATLPALSPMLSLGGTPVMASAKKGQLLVTKNCSEFDGTAGSSCTITSSNIAEITAGAKVFYDQAANTPAGMLDSNVVLVVSPGNWAVGRCTLELATYKGLCTFSDGTGQLAGFQARVDVSPVGGLDFLWDGTYSFGLKRDK
jgi:hypothetical protein